MKSINILGCEVSDLSNAEALARVKNYIEDAHQHYIVTPNPEIVLKAQKDKNLKLILNHADLALPDGFGLKIAGKILGQNPHNRITGADFTESIISLSEQERWPIFLLGGKDEKIAEQAAWHLRYKYKNAKIVGTASGGVIEFKQGRWWTSDEKLLQKINESRAKIIFVGFGCPKQEKWIFQNLDKLPNVKLAMTIGGTLDFFAGERKRAIYVLRKIGLEWLWRLIQEPKRFKRIWNATAIFLWTAIKWRARMTFKYRENVAAFIININNEVLLVKRKETKKDHWQIPQGGIDQGEDIEKALLREVKEETGTSDVEIIGMHPDYHVYDWPEWHQLNGGYKGQKQTIFYLKYNGNGSDIKVDQREIDDFTWIYIDDVVETGHNVRKDMLEMAVEGYREIMQSEKI
ncbi:WecB/TagA/CpsF family glycosyltransferase [Patescibacteria group bacterium]|nr:WecB/TagA/CpsF family glycosyltransferase [Patescibacteria group bacterium]